MIFVFWSKAFLFKKYMNNWMVPFYYVANDTTHMPERPSNVQD